MIIFCCRKDAKTLGREDVSTSKESVAVELPIVKEKEGGKSPVDDIDMKNQYPLTNNESPIKLDDQPVSVEMTSDDVVKGESSEVMV